MIMEEKEKKKKDFFKNFKAGMDKLKWPKGKPLTKEETAHEESEKTNFKSWKDLSNMMSDEEKGITRKKKK